MNAIMWFLYLADVVESIEFISGTIMLVTGIALIVWVPIYIMAYSNGDVNEEDKPFYTKLIKRLSIILSVAIFFNVMVPSKNTIYMMLGVKATGEVINEINKSPIAEKAYLLLEHKLDEALKDNNTPAPNTEAKSASDAK